MRDFFLFLSKNKPLTKLARKYGLAFGASRFVAGETIDKAIPVLKDLNQKGLLATIDFLGEFVDKEAEADERAVQTIEAIEAIGTGKFGSTAVFKIDLNGFRYFG